MTTWGVDGVDEVFSPLVFVPEEFEIFDEPSVRDGVPAFANAPKPINPDVLGSVPGLYINNYKHKYIVQKIYISYRTLITKKIVLVFVLLTCQ